MLDFHSVNSLNLKLSGDDGFCNKKLSATLTVPGKILIICRTGSAEVCKFMLCICAVMPHCHDDERSIMAAVIHNGNPHSG